MRKIKITLYLLFLLLAVGCSDVTEIRRIDNTVITDEELDLKIKNLMDAASVTGMTVSVFNHNEVVYQKAFGFANYEKGDSLKTDDVFYGASFSKAVFGYIVSQLVNQDVIDLDKPLYEYVDFTEWEFDRSWRGYDDIADDERYKDITARMCMTHTTGFQNWRFLSDSGFNPEGELAIRFDPGSWYGYSGEGIHLLQLVIEHITGKGLEQMAREMVFDPLNMNMTSYVWQERFMDDFCYGHTSDQEVVPKDTNDDAGAAGSMETTPEDYAKFVEHILNLTEEDSEITALMFEPHARIFSKVQFGPGAMERTDEYESIKLSYGLGWGLLQTPYSYGAFKEGHDVGFQHYSIIFPEKDAGIVIMSNSDNAESIFKELLEVAIGDVYTPWRWENYLPYDGE